MFPGLGRQDRQGEIRRHDQGARRHRDDGARRLGDRGRARARANGRWSRTASMPAASPPRPTMRISGPAAGHDAMKTNADPTGTTVFGMLNNCAGATTPWGTWLTCEENFNGYFWGKAAAEQHADAKALKRYGVPGEWYDWGKYHDRFDLAKEPNEPNRFGWVVEIDPMDPALGAGEAHRARPLQARRRRQHRQRRRPLRRLSGRRRTLRLRLQVRHRGQGRPSPTAPPTATSSTRARSTSRATMTTAPANGCRWCTARAADRRRTASRARPTF